ncbi:hypothetical protein [Rhodopirellula bahusiensis]|uniref:Uncharacterized protein n=1 Tax=Rhodopirellula bahusiensis TaxID=2014065 RepID=A0A2G1WAJ7_9BACT|nr:hypothetical protein [Rhodopirellula bahusiensis]PHQ36041.1 hypothetical protein CEE69_07590 [Rhodopirellula bahusiensis]
MPDWLRIAWFIVSAVWLAGAIGLFSWGVVSSWVWRRNNPEPLDPPEYEIVHDGSNPVAGCLACLMWPLMIPMALYEWLRYGNRSP